MLNFFFSVYFGPGHPFLLSSGSLSSPANYVYRLLRNYPAAQFFMLDSIVFWLHRIVWLWSAAFDGPSI